MSIMEQVMTELMEWNDKIRSGYELSEIEQMYLDGLRKAYMKLLCERTN
jgi:hypothetical protein